MLVSNGCVHVCKLRCQWLCPPLTSSAGTSPGASHQATTRRLHMGSFGQCKVRESHCFVSHHVLNPTALVTLSFWHDLNH